MARRDPLRLPKEERPPGGIAPLGSVDLQPVFGTRRRRPALGGPLPFVVAAVVLGIVAVLISGEREERRPEPASIDRGAVERDAVAPSITEPGDIEPGDIERRAPERAQKDESEPIGLEDLETETDTPASPPVSGSTGAGADRPGDEARALIASMRAASAEEDLDTVFRKAGEAMKSARLADAHLLYFFAARRGHAPAAFMLGGIYDPLHFDRERSLLGKPDPLQALKWYRVAAGQGDGEAEARLRALESWVDARARAGDAEAERLRLSWR